MKQGDIITLKSKHSAEHYVIVHADEYTVTCNWKDRAVNHKEETDATFYRVHLEEMIRNKTAVLIEK